MSSTSTLRSWWAGYLCNTAAYDRVPFPGPAGPWNLYTARAAVPAFDVFAELMKRHGYLFRESAGGTYVCRKIAGSDNYSLHAYAIALDLNPSKNPYGTYKTDMPPDFVDDVLGLRTSNGARVFTWGGNWSPASSADPMHYQIDASPSDLATGIVGYQPPTNGGDDMPWNQPGDPVETIDDADRVFAYQGSIFAGTEVASYLMGVSEREAREGLILGHAREVDALMVHDERLRDGGH